MLASWAAAPIDATRRVQIPAVILGGIGRACSFLLIGCEQQRSTPTQWLGGCCNHVSGFAVDLGRYRHHQLDVGIAAGCPVGLRENLHPVR